MRINRIEFQAVGPFAGKHEINFDQLGDSALFLIDGPTGAGKSTIIDAITYAIYGQMAGSESDATRMRSNHAKPDIETYVDLTFSTQHGQYRVRRTPAFDRPKSRGTGLTEQKATVLVEQLMPDGSRKNLGFQFLEAGKALGERIGLSREQFVQTVVLPQGEFAQFLRAGTKERQPLLERIFATEIYAKVVDVLKEQAKSAREATEAASIGVRTSLAALKASVLLDDDVYAEYEQLAFSSSTHELFVEALAQGLAQVEGEHAVAQKAFEVRQSQRAKLLSELSARQAEKAVLDRARDSDADLTSAQEALAALVGEIDTDALKVELGNIPKVSKSNEVDWAKTHAALQALIVEIRQVRKLDAEMPAKEQAREQAEARLVDLKLEIEATQKAIKKELPTAIKLLRAEHTSAVKALPDVAQVREKLEKLEQELEMAESLTKAETDQADLVASAEKAKAKTSEALKFFKSQSDARFANMASELAIELEDGKPCQVCGSKEHPHPAQLGDQAVTSDDLQKADSKVAKARDAQVKCDTAVTAGATLIATLKKQVKRSVEQIEVDLEAQQKTLEGETLARAEAERLAEELEGLEGELVEANGTLGNLTVEEATVATNLQALADEIADITSQSNELKGKHESTGHRWALLAQLEPAVKAIIDAEVVVTVNRDLHAAAKAAADALPAGESVGNVDSAKLAIDQDQPIFDAALTLKTQAEQKANAFAAQFKEIIAHATHRLDVEGDNAELLELSKWADGSNKLGQKLPAFVLQTMFEEVVTAANSRFTAILEGRYELQIPDDDPGRKGSRGLGLAVFDRTTETLRKTTTLSGGEQFCASLSLALGLSDVVLSNSSGLSIDTFFIDEGFGTLDSDRLGQVMQMLDGLKTDGRAVGLISHVEEMKSAIAERIDVRQLEKGGSSTLSVNWMNG